jgi:hypothetical protein
MCVDDNVDFITYTVKLSFTTKYFPTIVFSDWCHHNHGR